MTTNELIQKYWNYYLLLEQRFLETRNYVEFREENANTSSNGFGLLIIAIGAELDNFLKAFCAIPDEKRKQANMNDYKDYLNQNYPGIEQETIKILDSEMNDLSPFKDLGTGTLPWWQAYNHVKHDRNTHFLKANLINTISILSALYLLEMKMFKDLYSINRGKDPQAVDRPRNESKLFSINNWHFQCGYDLFYEEIPSKEGPNNDSNASNPPA